MKKRFFGQCPYLRSIHEEEIGLLKSVRVITKYSDRMFFGKRSTRTKVRVLRSPSTLKNMFDFSRKKKYSDFSRSESTRTRGRVVELGAEFGTNRLSSSSWVDWWP